MYLWRATLILFAINLVQQHNVALSYPYLYSSWRSACYIIASAAVGPFPYRLHGQTISENGVWGAGAPSLMLPGTRTTPGISARSVHIHFVSISFMFSVTIVRLLVCQYCSAVLFWVHICVLRKAWAIELYKTKHITQILFCTHKCHPCIVNTAKEWYNDKHWLYVHNIKTMKYSFSPWKSTNFYTA